jgi:hypothetical protein
VAISRAEIAYAPAATPGSKSQPLAYTASQSGKTRGLLVVSSSIEDGTGMAAPPDRPCPRAVEIREMLVARNAAVVAVVQHEPPPYPRANDGSERASR